jgi:hypothetical protein
LISSRSDKGSVFSFSYAMRLSRPFIWNLNPFLNNNDSLRVSKGNPDLQAQTFHTIGIQYRFSAGQSFFNLGLNHSYSNNMIVQYSTFNSSTGVTTIGPANIGISNQTALSVNMNGRFNPKLTLNINGRLSYDQVKNKILIGTVQKNTGLSGNMFLNSTYNFSKRFGASSYFGFGQQSVTLQGHYGLNYYYGSGVNYKMFNEKLTTNFSIVNFHEQYFNFRSEFADKDFRRVNQTAFLYRAFQISLIWNFGKLTENISKKKGVTNDDLLGK